ncbi:hypothetical protein AB0H73_09315 [Streptomyces olivoreticuli]
MPTIELDALLTVFDDSRKAVVEEAARALGLIWPCLNSACGKDNPCDTGLCHGCGYDRDGQPLSDQQPGLYPIPDELWEDLREHVRAWIGSTARPAPDAVTFPYTRDDDGCWSLTAPVLHYGGRTETVTADLTRSEVAETLDEIADEAEPGYLEDLRITL